MTEGTAAAVGQREQRRRQRRRLGREQLLDAAEEVFGRKGYHDTTLNEVAELAEFSVGSVYSFFDGKDDLFSQIFLRRGAQFMPAIREVLAPAAGAADPLEQLHRLVDFEVGWFRDHRHFGRLFLRHANASLLPTRGGQEAAIVANYEEAMELQTDLFRRGQSAGVFRPGDPAVLARLFSGIMTAFQALDPAVVSDEPAPAERFPLGDLHDLVESTFRA